MKSKAAIILATIILATVVTLLLLAGASPLARPNLPDGASRSGTLFAGGAPQPLADWS
jgi:hypothetical protein